jgi:hypothetical protein
MCFAAIYHTASINVNAFRFMPHHIIDYNMCLVAITRHFAVFDSVPNKFKTFELICIAMDNGYSSEAITDYINWDILIADDQDYLKLKYGIAK